MNNIVWLIDVIAYSSGITFQTVIIYPTICYMIREVLKYVDFFFDETKRKHYQINDTILKSALVYQYLYHLHFNTYISVSDVLELNDNEIGLIGPGNGCLTWFLERGLGWIDVLRSHGILHDAFGRFYKHYALDRGYTYAIHEDRTSIRMKKNPLCGQITGIIYCAIESIIV